LSANNPLNKIGKPAKNRREFIVFLSLDTAIGLLDIDLRDIDRPKTDNCD